MSNKQGGTIAATTLVSKVHKQGALSTSSHCMSNNYSVVPIILGFAYTSDILYYRQLKCLYQIPVSIFSSCTLLTS